MLAEQARGNNRIREYTATMVARSDHFLDNPECTFMHDEKIEDINAFYEQLWGEHQVIIIDTSQLNSIALETLTSVTSRLVFDYRKKQENRTEKPVHIILDEAHRYIKKDSKYLMQDNIFETIAREGRKFSLYLMVCSQRPSELSSTVLSQCANFFIHRIQNDTDMNFMRNIMPYFTDDLAQKIKLSVAGEAIIFGNCVPMPLYVKIEKPDPQPNSENCRISEQ